MQTRATAVAALGLVIATAATDANALIVARVTQHGYIMVDEDDAPVPYDGRVPVAMPLQFAGDVSRVLDEAGAPPADYIGVMQTSGTMETLAFYAPIKNDTLGIGMRDPRNPSRETFDL